ncbi:hypothetical protein TNCV_1670491 [Trichonephila clavipes]|nr:hypothetical protein TNCV_1670491 [Trichonephila clavipes]
MSPDFFGMKIPDGPEELIQSYRMTGVLFEKWQTNSPELRDRWKEIGMDIGQSVESKTQTLAPSKILGVAWNPD